MSQPMLWSRLLSAHRLNAPERFTSPEGGRSNFHRDHDRIIFSSAFRRLGRKTQVHPLAENDHLHTRLTHSLEVGSVGRSLGTLVGNAILADLPQGFTPEDLGAIVQGACLAHDIGNPPFGHAGEYAIRDWFRDSRQLRLLDDMRRHERLDLQTFEGNAQGLRVVSQLENHRFDGGMRLTFATLGTMLKYPWTVEYASTRGKFGAFQSEAEILTQIAEENGLLADGSGRWRRHPLSFLMEAADDICYAILDLEDGLEVSLLGYEEIEPLLLRLAGGVTDEIIAELALAPSPRRKIALLRGKAIGHMVNRCGDAFLAHYPQMMSGEFEGELLRVAGAGLHEAIIEAKALARSRIFNDRRKVEMEVGAYTTLDILLDAFCHATHARHQNTELSFRHRRILDLMEYDLPQAQCPLYSSFRRVLDFIGGMTDNYASHLSHQIGGIWK